MNSKEKGTLHNTKNNRTTYKEELGERRAKQNP